MKHQFKTFPVFSSSVDEEEGIVEAIVNVFGIIDEGFDVVHSGSFTKTLKERLGKIRVLDQHNAKSALNIVGKPLEIVEISREELPAEIREQYPKATGGLKTVTQYLLDTEKGSEIFKRIKAGVINEFSIGFDIIQQDYSKEDINGRSVKVRNIREIRLMEYSPVIWGMNQATTVVSVKETTPEVEKGKKTVGSFIVDRLLINYAKSLNILLEYGSINNIEFVELIGLTDEVMGLIDSSIPFELMLRQTEDYMYYNSNDVIEEKVNLPEVEISEEESDSQDLDLTVNSDEEIKTEVKDLIFKNLHELEDRLKNKGLI